MLRILLALLVLAFGIVAIAVRRRDRRGPRNPSETTPDRSEPILRKPSAERAALSLSGRTSTTKAGGSFKGNAPIEHVHEAAISSFSPALAPLDAQHRLASFDSQPGEAEPQVRPADVQRVTNEAEATAAYRAIDQLSSDEPVDHQDKVLDLGADSIGGSPTASAELPGAPSESPRPAEPQAAEPVSANAAELAGPDDSPDFLVEAPIHDAGGGQNPKLLVASTMPEPADASALAADTGDVEPQDADDFANDAESELYHLDESGDGESDLDPAGGTDGDKRLTERTQTPRRYRPAPRLPRPERVGGARARSKVSDRALSTAIRLSFRPGYICQFSLLAERRQDLPEEVEVRARERTETFRALQDDWYELKAPDDLSGLLRDGAVWTTARSVGIPARWMLPHRDVYVLGVVADFGGYVTAPRLTVGEDHVVLCSTDRRGDVTTALAAAGCVDFRQVDANSGVPDGWIAFRSIRPSRSVPATNDGDILDTLRPLAAIEIALEGGIKLERSAWLVGHGPTIRIVGDLANAGEIQIDSQPALVAEDGTCVSPNQEELGEHIVWSSGATKRYLIIPGQADWKPWIAHRTSNASICGAAVFPATAAEKNFRQIVVPTGDFTLLGPRPGMVYHCARDASSRSAVAVTFPAFDPVWIVPRHPLRSDRRAAKVKRLGSDLTSPSLLRTRPKGRHDAIRQWATIILDAHRRKLILDPADVPTADLWKQYERAARSIWRRLK